MKKLDICYFVKNNCEPNSNYDFFSLYYCNFYHIGKVGKYIVFLPIGFILVFVFMYNLASTADEYLSPSLEYITVRFKISESLAGVTFLAFGNGAPDVFSSIASAASASFNDGDQND